MKSLAPCSEEEKRRALDQVLESETFARSDKLRQFLRYIAELEMSGRAGEITEYTIGVEALGRPPDYSTADDSIVRSTAYVLRQKLLELYDKELPDAPLRIEIHKGSYVPYFAPPPVEEPEPPRADSPVREAPALASRLQPFGMFALGFLAALVLGGIAGAIWLNVRVKGPFDPVVAEAWGALARQDSNVRIFTAPPPHFLVRPYQEGEQPSDALIFPVPPKAYSWYHGLQPLEPGTRLYTYATGNSWLMGDGFATVMAVGTLARMGVKFQIVSERTVRLSEIQGRNALLFGHPDYSPAIAAILVGRPFSIHYDPAGKQDVIAEKLPAGAPRIYRPRSSPQVRVEETFGLITCLGTPTHTVIVFSGVNAAGTYAAVRFFSSPLHLNQLKQRLQAEGYDGFPFEFQILVRATTETSVPISVAYVAHRVTPSRQSSTLIQP